jgi:hypothetical protein
VAHDSFWQVLAGKFADTRATGPSAASWTGATVVRQTFDPGLRAVLLGGSSPWSDRPVTRVDRRASETSTPATPTGEAGPTGRPHRRRLLTDAQRAALEVLTTAGAAGLGEELTAAGLRRAYRRLALRWHPDRHPHASAADRAHLATTFAEITAAYRTLVPDLRSAA